MDEKEFAAWMAAGPADMRSYLRQAADRMKEEREALVEKLATEQATYSADDLRSADYEDLISIARLLETQSEGTH